MDDTEKLAYLQGFLLGLARRVEMLPILVAKVGQDPSSTAMAEVCARMAKDCTGAASIAGPADVTADGEGLEPQE